MSDTTRPKIEKWWTQAIEIPPQKTSKYILLADKEKGDIILIDGDNKGSIMAILSDYYNLEEERDIRDLLEGNERLVALLVDAHKRIQKYFPASSISIKPLFEELVVSIGTTLSPKEAKARIYKFDEEWWLGVDADLRSKLCITVEFQ